MAGAHKRGSSMSGRLVAAIMMTFIRAELVHLNQQLVEGLLALVARSEAGAAPAADRVNLVYENNARGILLSLVKQVTLER